MRSRTPEYTIKRREARSRPSKYEGTTTPSWGIWPFYDGLTPYFDAIQDLRDQYPTATYDLAKSEQLFNSIGYTKGADGMYASADGKPLKSGTS